MQNYRVDLASKACSCYMCQRAANSLDIDVKKKLTHSLSIAVDVASSFNVGAIVGASGSGKTTLARVMFGDESLTTSVDMASPVLHQFPEAMTYDDRASRLLGIGLTSVPCWIRPVGTLSNGQKARAEAALAMAGQSTCVIDEFTSVVDRDVARVMSHCVQKFARKSNAKVVVCACHYDILEWLKPDWVIDCNAVKYERFSTTDWDVKKKSRSGSQSEKQIDHRGECLASITI